MTSRKGFTLVELSIVLVVVGLLIGGILAARSMIQTTKINAFVRQIQSYDIVLENFYLNYKQLPGDSTRIPPFGDNDGKITDDSATHDGDGDFLYEAAGYWVQLYNAGLIKEAYTATVTGVLKPGVNVPLAKIGNNAGIMVGTPNDVGAPENISFIDDNTYYISGYATAGTNYDVINAISAPDTYAIDLKIDDGLANSGNMVAQGAGTDISSSPTTTANSGCMLSTNKTRYIVSSTAAFPCSFAIRISATSSKLLYKPALFY